MCDWTQKGGKMRPVESSQQVLLPPLGRCDVAVLAKGLSSPQGLSLLCPALRNALLGTLQHAGLSPVTALLSAHLSWIRHGSSSSHHRSTEGSLVLGFVALC